MIGGEHGFGVERGGDGDGELLRQGDQLRASVGGGHAAAGHDDRSFRLRSRGPARRRSNFDQRPVGRAGRPANGDSTDDFQFRFHIDHPAAVDALQFDMRGTRCARYGRAKRLPQMVGQFCRARYIGAVLGHGGKRRHVINFLIGVSQLMLPQFAPGDGDDRRTGKPGVLQARGQVDSAHRLRHDRPGPRLTRA